MTSSKNDVTFWKTKAEEIEKELEEFRESSLMLEKELEGSLEQADKSIKELRLKNNSLQLENDTLRDKYDELQRVTVAQVTELEEEMTQGRKREEDYVKYIRELEQKNDDLERSQRAMYVSLGDFETKLNSALERNVLLESELDEKESLKTMVQRLKDEARDLKQEIHVREKDNKLHDNDKSRLDSNKLDVDSTPTPPNCLPPLKNLNGMSTPSRVSAMNIVGDLLRRVGVLESKFAVASGCNGAQTEGGRSISPGIGGDKELYRRGRLNRGTSSPSIHNLVRS